MRNLFRRHPVREEIAGTVESIRRITADDLRLCHNSFYVPANMVLCAMGDLDPSEVLAAVDAKLKTDGRGGLMARRNLPAEPLSLAQPQSRLTMPVSLPRLYLGFKGPVARLAPTVGADAECAAELWLDAVLGEAGEPYERLYASGLITDDFAWSVTHDAGMTWAIVGGQTPDAAELRNELSSILEAGRREDAFDEDLGRVRKRFLGDYIRSFDSPETCCWNVVESHFRKLDLFTYPNRVARLKAGRVARYCRDFFTPARMTEVTIIPAGT
jgi:predicted Zn-dependent peptidase